MWLEVETKIKVSKPKIMRQRIQKIANLEKKESRGDDYFAIKRKGYPKKAFRIRYDGKKFVLGGIQLHEIFLRFTECFIGLRDLLVLVFQQAIGPRFQQVDIDHHGYGCRKQNLQ